MVKKTPRLFVDDGRSRGDGDPKLAPQARGGIRLHGGGIPRRREGRDSKTHSGTSFLVSVADPGVILAVTGAAWNRSDGCLRNSGVGRKSHRSARRAL